MSKKTIVFDFDGVIHLYNSGWQGATVIPDPPVEGISEAIRELRAEGYEVIVVSTRCAESGGVEAIKVWLEEYGIEVDGISAEKPPALVYVDDRAICFDGRAALLPNKIKNFKVWWTKMDGTVGQTEDAQIEEMAKLACTVFAGRCSECPCKLHSPCAPKASAEQLYTAGYRKVRRGAWIAHIHDWDFGDYEDYKCSLCGSREQNKRNFCPDCGADMRGDTDAEIH